MMECGLLGRTLGHSFSPWIHEKLGSYSYKLYPTEPENLKDFLQSAAVTGLNVTTPYKNSVLPYCDSLSQIAAKTGSVNTVVKKNGKWIGYNTDHEGFCQMVRHSGIDVKGKKAIIFGSGGVSPTIRLALKDLGAGEIVTVSRRGENNYGNLDNHLDAEILVNATPLGMFPGNGEMPANPARFSNCTGVFDLIYNPLRTVFLQEAERCSIPCCNGIYMLVAQGIAASQIFSESEFNREMVDKLSRELEKITENIVLIGMPGSGKTTIGKMLAQETGRKFFDSDTEIEKTVGISVSEILNRNGEKYFRAIEAKVLSDLGKKTGVIISTGGGCVTEPTNYAHLHQNGQIFWIKRDTSQLPVVGRPLSQNNKLEKLYKTREKGYRNFSDCEIDNNTAIENAVSLILEEFK